MTHLVRFQIQLGASIFEHLEVCIFLAFLHRQKKSLTLWSDIICHVKLRASKLPVFKVRFLRDLNQVLLRESLIIGISIDFPMISDSRGRPGFKSRRSRTLKTGNFEALKVTAMYFTFLETSSLFLFGQERS